MQTYVSLKMNSMKYICACLYTTWLVRLNHMKINISMKCKLKTKQHYVVKQAHGDYHMHHNYLVLKYAS